MPCDNDKPFRKMIRDPTPPESRSPMRKFIVGLAIVLVALDLFGASGTVILASMVAYLLADSWGNL